MKNRNETLETRNYFLYFDLWMETASCCCGDRTVHDELWILRFEDFFFLRVAVVVSWIWKLLHGAISKNHPVKSKIPTHFRSVTKVSFYCHCSVSFRYGTSVFKTKCRFGEETLPTLGVSIFLIGWLQPKLAHLIMNKI